VVLNFLAAQTFEVHTALPLDDVLERVRAHIQSLPVRKGWRDFTQSRLAMDYWQEGPQFTVKERINMGRNDITITAVGTGTEDAGGTLLSITYTVGPRWMVGFLWLFAGIAGTIFFSLVAAFAADPRPSTEWFFLLMPLAFFGVSLLINGAYQLEARRLHRGLVNAVGALF